jgi:hypothetical protein
MKLQVQNVFLMHLIVIFNIANIKLLNREM